jgi:DNA-binding transcriptional LysR family regulator
MDPYKVLIEVMKTESFTRAAENLYTSQPSVSRDIKRLEFKYNVKIFEFKSPYLKLTRDGEKLLQYALQRESIEQELWQNLTSESEIISGTLTIGSSYTYGEYLLSEQLTNLMQQYPKLHIHLRVNNSDSVINDIKHNRIDIGIVEKEIQDNAIKCKEIMEDEMVYIYKKSVQPRMDICFVREKGSGTRFYQEVGLSELKLNPYLIEINNIKIIKQMVEAGNGFAIISKSAIYPEDYEKLMITTLNVKRHTITLLNMCVDKYIGKNIRAVIEMIMK